MKSIDNMITQGYRYRDYPELIDAIIKVKKATLIASKNIHRFESSYLNNLIQACDKSLELKNFDRLNTTVYAGAKGTLNKVVDSLLIDHLEKDDLCMVKEYSTILRSSCSVNGVVLTACDIVVRKNLLKLAKACEHFSEILHEKAKDFDNTVKLGRIGLQDYLPMTYREEFEGYAYAIDNLSKQLLGKADEFNKNALGTNELGSLSFFDLELSKESSIVLSELTNYQVEPFENSFDAVMGTSRILLAHATVQAVSTAVWRVARDIRMMCSGPRAGLQEISVPAVAPGSSIMPGKLNPVIAEMVFTTVDQVDANHAGLSLALKSGWLEGGNGSFVPLRCLMNSCDLLARTMDLFAELCIKGISVDEIHSRNHASQTLALTIVLEAFTNKATADKVLELALSKNCSIAEAACELQVLPEDEIHDILDVNKLSDPNEVSQLFKRYKQ